MPTFRLLGLDHVVLRCRDAEAMIAFYRDILGGTVAKRNDKRGLIHVRVGAAMIDLVTLEGELGRAGGAGPGTEGRNMDHLCLRIEPFDLAQLTAYFDAHGIALREPRTRYGAEGDGVSAYVFDPEGNRVELKGPSTPAN